ncbi:MAG TPA: glycosyltransferase, partial [Acidobacteriaceae bacterium]|nr:glycosyltransferase [Acidobacteriaceae bacterium]
MFLSAILLAVAPLALVVYAYALYPAILWLVGRRRGIRNPPADPPSWPYVTITVPVHNGGNVVRSTIDQLLRLDYPRDRLEILVISDASTDDT